MSVNLPETQSPAQQMKKFFDRNFNKAVTFPAGDIDASVAFFMKRGFDQTSAMSTAITVLNQARLENVPPFKILDTFKNLTDLQLSQVVAQIVNTYRENTSFLGYRVAPASDTYESRNILV
jgi:hypothetical protein